MSSSRRDTIEQLSASELRGFRRRLLGWFRGRKRDLPWRRTRDPYRIWLSEVMLQQTRVAVVIPYYRRFLKRFPTVRALARAPAEQVLRLWAGLGYYRRARNLHRAAKEVVARHQGRLPREFAAALALPGIGHYTAAAVLSIAHGRPHAVLDGNVARVLARLSALHGNLREPRRWQQLQRTADRLLAPGSPGQWNQALMELGATVCTPHAPRCDACPVSRWCQAYQEGIAEELPATRRKRVPVKVTLAAAVLLDPRGRTLMVKPDGADSDGNAALFSRMWQFPAVRVFGRAQQELARYLRATLGLGGARLVRLPLARHRVTFREITLAPFLVRVACLPDTRRGRTLQLPKLDRIPVSSATRKIAAAAFKQLRAGAHGPRVRVTTE